MPCESKLICLPGSGFLKGEERNKAKAHPVFVGCGKASCSGGSTCDRFDNFDIQGHGGQSLFLAKHELYMRTETHIWGFSLDSILRDESAAESDERQLHLMWTPRSELGSPKLRCGDFQVSTQRHMRQKKHSDRNKKRKRSALR